MIRVNLAELEQLTNNLTKSASDSDEALQRLRQISTEMQNDLELETYPQQPILLEATALATASLNRANETLQSLRGTMLSVANTYKETEQKHKNALNRMIDEMSKIQVEYCAVIDGGVAHSEETEERALQNSVEQMVTSSVEELQIANIASLSKVVEEEYEISQILPIES